MTSINKRSEGKFYEKLAADYLQGLGYLVLAQNYHASVYGEIDLVLSQPEHSILVFVEVKARKSLEAALDSLSTKKKLCLFRSAQHFIDREREVADQYAHSRFDLLAVIMGTLGDHRFEHVLGIDLS